MIKVINGYKVKWGADIQPILLRLHEHAMTYPGYGGADNLINDNNPAIVAIITTWDSPANWQAWQDSRRRAEIMRDAAPLLEEELKVTVYRVLSTITWLG